MSKNNIVVNLGILDNKLFNSKNIIVGIIKELKNIIVDIAIDLYNAMPYKLRDLDLPSKVIVIKPD